MTRYSRTVLSSEYMKLFAFVTFRAVPPLVNRLRKKKKKNVTATNKRT